ncbi:MAG: AEC family transporter [Lachnospiraceae bacterium]|nr:AEC family transporter [Lachnospiraceae bacterium]
MTIQVLLRQMILIFLEIAVGFAGAKLGIITDRDSKFLSDLVMKVTLPCTLLASTDIDAGQGTVLLMLEGFLLLEALYLISTAICLAVARARHLTAGEKAVFIGVTVLPNSAFVGIPLVTGILGDSVGMVYVASGMIAYNLFFFTYVARLFQPGSKIDFKSFLTPANLTTAVMVLMLLTGLRFPSPLQSFFDAMGGCTTPLALLIVGVMLAGSDLLALVKRPFLYLITILRNLLFPLAFLLVLWLLPLDRTMCMGVCILAACPAGSLTAVLARQHEMEGELAGQAVAQSTLAMIVTVPLLLGIASALF